jgi:hypothetical protein
MAARRDKSRNIRLLRDDPQPSDTGVAPITSSITIYDVSGERQIGH